VFLWFANFLLLSVFAFIPANGQPDPVGLGMDLFSLSFAWVPVVELCIWSVLNEY
jgi:hypothetical protein